MRASLRADLVRLDRILQDAAERGDRARDADAVAPADPGCALPGLRRAAGLFALSSFERDVLLLALAVEIDGRYARLVGVLEGDPVRRRPTVGLCARLFAGWSSDAHCLAVTSLRPDGHLARMGLIELLDDGPLAVRELRIAPAFWLRLLGPDRGPFVVERLARDRLDELVLHPDTEAAARGMIAWGGRGAGREVLFSIVGPAGSGRHALAGAVFAALGYATLVIEGAALEQPGVIAAVVREAAWHLAGVAIRAPVGAEALARFGGDLSTPIAVLGDVPRARMLITSSDRRVLELAITELDAAGRERLWRALLPPEVRDRIDVVGLAARFHHGPGAVAAGVTLAAARRDAIDGGEARTEDFEVVCRAADGAASPLVQRIVCPYAADDIVLAPATRRELELLVAWVKHGPRVFRDGAAGEQIHGRGGFVALFSGPPGTGKTMAAQVIAAELGLDLLRVDLSQVVNKYIGETEKNLDRVFADAQATSAMLLFDEADALFGKRTEVKDAHDRYANVETAYLLQRLEAHRGVVILTTNLHRNLDDAFLRRIQIVAEFAIPGPEERLAIWRRHLVADHVARDVDLALLATRFPVAGGDIRNAVTTAILLAAADGTQIEMRHLVLGIWRELRKAGRLLTPEDFGPWAAVVGELGRTSRSR